MTTTRKPTARQECAEQIQRLKALGNRIDEARARGDASELVRLYEAMRNMVACLINPTGK